MIKDFWKMYQNENVDNIIIKNNIFRVTGFIEVLERFKDEESLRNIIRDYFTNSRYNKIVLVKIIQTQTNKPKYIKVSEDEYNKSEFDSIILCQKEYLNILREEIRNIYKNNLTLKKSID